MAEMRGFCPFAEKWGARPKRRAAITAQSHNLLQDFLILTNLVSNASSHRAEEIGIKNDKG